MNHIRLSDEWLNVLVLITLVITLAMKGFALRRHSELGESMALFNFVLVIAYFTAILAYFVDAFRSEWYRFTVRISVMVSAMYVIWAMKRAYGGWKNLYVEIWSSFLDLLPFGCGEKINWLTGCFKRKRDPNDYN